MRKIEVIKADSDKGRDSGKHFEIREWDAEIADRWATRVVLALTRGSKPMPFPVEALLGRGMEAIFVIGLQTILSASVATEEVIPLLDELLQCVRFVRDPAARDKSTGGHITTDIVSPDDIEEVRTRWWLRSEVLRVHTGFSAADMFGTLLSSIMSKAPRSGNTEALPAS
ncbi:hypothetical protein H8A95_16010 [Bradyrhizobium sp. Pear76]|uniref:hypothetical protein n=1 Tax=Bradyrhizobium oropedii TaxID=1571201 RepID=UPI001E4EDCF6|nr:hypothetical protein [Bradyrhizobium oropedii]MCC8963776.1 hypothetical protein [Bradyrhizobium oropedii]